MSSSKLKDMRNVASRAAYCKVASDLTTFCLSVSTGGIEGFKDMQCTPEMTEARQEFMASLGRTSTEAQDAALHSFLFSLFTQKRCGTASKFVFPAYDFLVMYSFRPDGNLRSCGYFSQYFSKAVFIVRLMFLKEIRARAKHDNAGFFE